MTKVAALTAIWIWLWWALVSGRNPFYLALLSVSYFLLPSLPLMLINLLWLLSNEMLRNSDDQTMTEKNRETRMTVERYGINIVWIFETIGSFNFSSSQLSPSTFALLFSSRPGGMERDISSHFSSVLYSSCSSPKELHSLVYHHSLLDL